MVGGRRGDVGGGGGVDGCGFEVGGGETGERGGVGAVVGGRCLGGHWVGGLSVVIVFGFDFLLWKKMRL